MQCQAYREQYGCDFISAMPTNLYGPGDNFDLEGSHVLPALLRRFHAAKIEASPEIDVWGTGRAVPRVSTRRRLRRCAGVPVEELFPVRHHKRRNGDRSHHRGARRDDRRCRGLSRPHRVRSVQARRHAAQAARCRAPDGVGMAREDRTARGHRRYVRLVPRPARERTMLCAALPSPKTREAADDERVRHRLSRSFRSSPPASTPRRRSGARSTAFWGRPIPTSNTSSSTAARPTARWRFCAATRNALVSRASPIAACTTP